MKKSFLPWSLLGLLFVVLLATAFYLSRPMPSNVEMKAELSQTTATPIQLTKKTSPTSEAHSRALVDLDRATSAPIPQPTAQPTPEIIVSREPQPNWPLVFRDTSGLSLNPAQQKVITDLQDRFTKEVGERQDPYNPIYRARWLNAQAEADSQLREALGSQVMDRLQINGAQEDHAGQ